MTPLRTLIDRVESGEVGRELDAEVDDWLLANNHRAIRSSPGTPAWSTSIDAQAALGRIVRVEVHDDFVVAAIEHGEPTRAPTEYAARLAALLRGMG